MLVVLYTEVCMTQQITHLYRSAGKCWLQDIVRMIAGVQTVAGILKSKNISRGKMPYV